MSERKEAVGRRQAFILVLLIALQVPAWAFFVYGRAAWSDASSSGYLPHQYETYFEEDSVGPADTGAVVPIIPTFGTEGQGPEPTRTPSAAPTSTPVSKGAPTATRQSQKPGVMAWNTLSNPKMGISFSYPSYFKYGIAESTEGEGIQILSYDPGREYSQSAPVGLKMEVYREINDSNMSLLEWAALHVEDSAESLNFKNVKVNGLDGLARYTQENDLAVLLMFVAKERTVYMIMIAGTDSEYHSNKSLLDKMIGTIQFRG